MTSAFSRAVCESGKVVSYEKRQDFLEKAQKNVRHLGHIERVTFVSGDVVECKESQKADAFFLDVPNPPLPFESAVSILRKVAGSAFLSDS